MCKNIIFIADAICNIGIYAFNNVKKRMAFGIVMKMAYFESFRQNNGEQKYFAFSVSLHQKSFHEYIILIAKIVMTVLNPMGKQTFSARSFFVLTTCFYRTALKFNRCKSLFFVADSFLCLQFHSANLAVLDITFCTSIFFF